MSVSEMTLEQFQKVVESQLARIEAMKAQGYGYSDALVKKFHLEYDEIVRRLS